MEWRKYFNREGILQLWSLRRERELVRSLFLWFICSLLGGRVCSVLIRGSGYDMAWMEGKVDMACRPGVLVLTGSELFFRG